jgi:hypothetical protein
MGFMMVLAGALGAGLLTAPTVHADPAPTTRAASTTKPKKIPVRFKARSTEYTYTCAETPEWRRWREQGRRNYPITDVVVLKGWALEQSIDTYVTGYISTDPCKHPARKIRPGRLYNVTYATLWAVRDKRCNNGKTFYWEPIFRRAFRIPAGRTTPMVVHLDDTHRIDNPGQRECR